MLIGLRGIRGAITVESNTVDDIRAATIEMIETILKENLIRHYDVISAEFTMTKDLNCAYPAKFAREIEGFDNIPLMCYQELEVEGALPKCIRVLILVNTPTPKEFIKHVYLREAKKLRPDLIK